MSKDDVVGTNEGLARRMTALEDLEAIRALMARYAETVDAALTDPSAEKVGAILELFAEDASADYEQFGQFQGRAGIGEFFGKVLPTIGTWSRHHLLNPIVEVKHRSASGKFYGLVHVVFKSDPAAGPQRLWVDYRNTYSKSEHGWKIQSLKTHFDSPPGAG